MRHTLSPKGIEWINMDQPTNEELAAFVREANLLPVDAEFIIRDHQRPEIAARPNYLLMLVHVPVFDKKLRVTSGVALYILVTDQKIYTVQYEPIVSLRKLIKDFTDNPEKQEEYFADNPLSLALHVLSQLNISSFRKIRRLGKHIEIAEDAVFHGNERKMVEEVAILTRDVLDFRKIIRPQVAIFSTMPEHAFGEDAAAQWQRVSAQMKQLWEMLDSLHESTRELRNTNDSLLQYKENELLRTLTLYSIIAIPLWILVSPYNPHQPGAIMTDQIVFWGVLGILVLLLIYILARFRRKRVI